LKKRFFSFMRMDRQNIVLHLYMECGMLTYIMKEVIFFMAKTANMYIRIDPDVKSDVEAIYSRYGMSITDAINVFLYTSRNIGGLPFDLRPSIPNAETLEAIEEVKRMKKDPSLGKAYTDVDQMMKELLT